MKLQYFGQLMQRADSLEETLMPGKIESRRTKWMTGWDGWMASPTQWTWVCANSGRWWRTGRPGVLQSVHGVTESRTRLSHWTATSNKDTLPMTPGPAQLAGEACDKSACGLAPSFSLMLIPTPCLVCFSCLPCLALTTSLSASTLIWGCTERGQLSVLLSWVSSLKTAQTASPRRPLLTLIVHSFSHFPFSTAPQVHSVSLPLKENTSRLMVIWLPLFL